MNVIRYHSVLSALDSNNQHVLDIPLTDYESSVLRTTLALLRGAQAPEQTSIQLDEHTKQLLKRMISEDLMPLSTLARMSKTEEQALTDLLNDPEASLPLEQCELLRDVLHKLYELDI